ncbi:methionine--tRNA ligase [Abiotrophia defectiva ATCC 49176]|uniref:Methionine--tRNA ligase n=2 Tax=Abiotrophia defectiva TaxID=46125 RepID=W1Q3J8_ABIDE|nr:methionine--tRNA ligase [Abiotrophia defectiva ATCC 49176]
MTRYKRLQGFDAFFLTGTDEHGQKIERTAEGLGVSPKQYVDEMADIIKKLWALLDIDYSHFIRTTDDYHEKAVQDAFEQLLAQDDIYLGEYSGWYSVSDEEFFTENQLVEVYRDADGNVTGGVAPTGNEVTLVKEESYFFRMSKYADRLVQYYEDHADFLEPAFRKTEMINNFIKPGLEDLAVSRTTFTWGVPVKSNPKHVIYVWIDALLNYITALGYGSDDTSRYNKYWPADAHVIGKDISRFHMIYWPTILMALGLPLPKKIFAHGWYLMKEGKMSKSKGNVIYPETLVERYGLDATRFYLLHEMGVGNDAVFTPEGFVQLVNSELANDLGNLLNRTVAMMNKYFQGQVPTEGLEATAVDADYDAYVKEQIAAYYQAMDAMSLSAALSHVMDIVSRTNKYIDETMPWVLVKEEATLGQLRSVMNHLAEALRLVAHLSRPFMTQAPAKIFEQLGLSDQMDLDFTQLVYGAFPAGASVVAKGTPIFPRLDAEAEVTYIQEAMAAGKPGASQAKVDDPNWDPEATELVHREVAEAEFDDFLKIEMKVAEVLDVQPVKGSNKLLRFRLDAGDKAHRQILSGIAKFYPNPEELIGRKVCIVSNLKPRKMMGYVSQGMILSSEQDGQLHLLAADPNAANGAWIG